MIAPGWFPILDQCITGRWRLLYGELEFWGTEPLLPVPPGFLRVQGLHGPGLVDLETYEVARHHQDEGWCYQ
jgi:hypothetical protein